MAKLFSRPVGEKRWRNPPFRGIANFARVRRQRVAGCKLGKKKTDEQVLRSARNRSSGRVGERRAGALHEPTMGRYKQGDRGAASPRLWLLAREARSGLGIDRALSASAHGGEALVRPGRVH